MHAAGVVISEGPLWDHVPVFCPEPGVYVTQYDKDDVEAAGLVKFDFLGLKTLTVLDIAVQLIDKRPDRDGEPFDLDAIPLDDKATFALLQSGETTNVFQLESSGHAELFKQLKPDCFEDIVAAVALYRPGPMGAGMHNEDFISASTAGQKVEYPHPSLEPILQAIPTGVIVYQEQVMQIARVMAGYSLGGADLLRRAMGKKKEKEMVQKQRAIFLEGATEERRHHGRSPPQRLRPDGGYFAGYGFNKSHAAAYGLVTYQTAYLKAHYPVEFVCATLTADKEKTDKVVRTVAEARELGITVLPPDMNDSAIDFTVVYDPASGVKARAVDRPVSSRGKLRDPAGPQIRFGLGGVKGIGQAALEAIFEARDKRADGEEAGEPQPFTDLYDFASRVDLKRVNKGVAEALVQCGAMDAAHAAIDVHRAQAHRAIEAALDRGRKASADRASGQTSLFGLLAPEARSEAERIGGRSFADVEPWDMKELLAREKATLGFYVSGHPIERYAAELRRFADCSTASVGGRGEGSRVTIGGSVEGYYERNTRGGSKMAFFHLEDSEGRLEVIVRAGTLDNVREVLGAGDPVLLTGDVKFERDRNAPESEAAAAKLILLNAAPLAEELRARTKAVRVSLPADRIDPGQLKALKETLEGHPGPCPVTLEVVRRARWTVQMGATGHSVEPSEAFLSSLERLFGEKVCELR